MYYEPPQTPEEQQRIRALNQKHLSWALYWLGDQASKILNLNAADNDPYAEQWCNFWYPVYNKLMCWSSDVQGETENGPWGAVLKEEDSSPEQE